MRILCVCLGNICRSPLADGVLRARAGERGLALAVDSAGTGGWHLGDPPHPGSIRAAARRGIDISGQRARQVAPADFAAFDLMLAMDASNRRALERLKPRGSAAEVRLFDPDGRDVPDPYGEGAEAFERVLDQIERGADALLARIGGR